MAQELDDGVRREVRGRARGDIEQRVDLDEIEPDDIGVLRQGDETRPQLVVGKAVRLAGDATGDEGHVEDVDIDADVDRGVRLDGRDDIPRSAVAILLHRHDAVPIVDRIVDVAVMVPQASDAYLGDRSHVGHAPDVPHRLHVRIHVPVPERRVVDVGVEVDDIDGSIPRPHNWGRDRMIPADHDR